jgi:hypothetical protein
MKLLSVLMLFFFMSCATQPPAAPSPLVRIKEIGPNKWTHLTKQNLEHLVQVYDLKPFIFTDMIHIQSRVVPHSHPVLTLNSRFAESPHRLLSVFLHEQLHWWGEMNPEKVNLAIKDLKNLIPVIPKEGMARNQQSTYLHFIICYLDYRALQHFLGKKQADHILVTMIEEDKIYPWIYGRIFEKYHDIEGIIRKHQLEPHPLNVPQNPTKNPSFSTES